MKRPRLCFFWVLKILLTGALSFRRASDPHLLTVLLAPEEKVHFPRFTALSRDSVRKEGEAAPARTGSAGDSLSDLLSRTR